MKRFRELHPLVSLELTKCRFIGFYKAVFKPDGLSSADGGVGAVLAFFFVVGLGERDFR